LSEIFGEGVVTELDEDLTREVEILDPVTGRRYIVRGRIDALLTELNVGVEIKSDLSDKDLPKPQHVFQAKVYNFMYDLDYTLLLYITPHGIYEYKVADRVDEDELLRRIKSTKAPRYAWECKYCQFAPICHVPRAGKKAEGLDVYMPSNGEG